MAQKDKNFIKLRKRKIYRMRAWLVIKIIFALGFFIAAIWSLNYFYNSRYFKVKYITLEGNGKYQAEDILGILPEIEGSNIFEVNKKDIEDSILELLVWVKEADMRKIFPDRIEIKLTERKPFIKIHNRGKYYLMDNEGVVLEDITGTNPEEDYRELLIVKNIIGHEIHVGEKIAKKNVISCGNIFLAMDNELKEIISGATFRNDDAGSIVFIANDGMEIIFGTSEDTVKKIEILKQILKEDVKYNIIDLSNPDKPVVIGKESYLED
ncbi:MAG: FtsQ-type POTRA domain-containing protein [Actinobacteria bacterium]|nr:FtsQ-type POTRA domain-containing protein [Actinomycetota bacterium]